MTVTIMVVVSIIASTIATLKNIFVVKYGGFYKYLFSLLDHIVHLISLKLVASNLESLNIYIAYVVGRMIGLWIATIIQEIIIEKISVVRIYTNNRLNEIESVLKQLNISYTVFTGRYVNGERYILETHVNKKSKKLMMTRLSEFGELTFDETEVVVNGKIKKRIHTS